MVALDGAVAPQGRAARPGRCIRRRYPAPAQSPQEPGVPPPFVRGARTSGSWAAARGGRGQTYPLGADLPWHPHGPAGGPEDRARLDGLGLRLILDLRGTNEAAALPDYVPGRGPAGAPERSVRAMRTAGR